MLRLVLLRGLAKKSKGAASETLATAAAGTPDPVPGLLAVCKDKMKAQIERFETKISNIRVDGANPELLSKVAVQVPGGKTAWLPSLAMITAPTPLKLLVALNDRELLSVVEKAISGSGLNLQPRADAQQGTIEIFCPRPTREQRESRVKDLAEETERSKVALRGFRQDTQKKLKQLKLSEDKTKANEKLVTQMTTGAEAKITAVAEAKKKELLGNAKQQYEDEE
ncbi:ribosome recycling factor [Batrachochytrium salamandrivorans]|nr:ribosome recycling factor [Batrachochytrium salamandrivorans]